MVEYIVNYYQNYQRINKNGLKVLPKILAFKLLRNADIARAEKTIVLTGMDYKDRGTLYDHAKKFKGRQATGGCKGEDSDNSAIKLEPAFLAENEEVLYTAGYVKRGGWKPGQSRGRGRGRSESEEIC